MSSLDKDLFQKQKAIKYCISNNVLPFLEVIVGNVREITSTTTTITDLDVLGIELSRRGQIKKTIFDCKTVNKMSPINRAFWASGVMRFTGADEAYVILKKKAVEAHRLSAKVLNVHLFSENDFDKYAQSANINYLDSFSYAANIDSWHQYYSLFKKFNSIENVGDFLNNKIPLEKDHAKALRELIGAFRSTKGEFDPEKPEHMAIFYAAIMTLLLILCPIATQLADAFNFDSEKSEYEQLLRYYIWGGRESYMQRRELKNAALEASGAHGGELELPSWSSFVHMTRSLIDAPNCIRHTLIPCRELSLRSLSESSKECDKYLLKRLNISNRSIQFIFLASKYFVAATGLPQEFDANLRKTISKIKEATNE